MNLSKRELIMGTATLTLAVPLAADIAQAIDMSPATDRVAIQCEGKP